MAPRWPTTGQEAPRGLKDVLQEGPKGQIIDGPKVFEGFGQFLVVSSPTAQDGPKCHQHRP
eukprot:3680050-Pyramimonas_sp.AAC.1